MAAWLAFLKSKLLIPKQPGEEGESGEELAAVLQFRLKRLEAMRDASARLVNRNRLGRDVFARGMPEMVIIEKRNAYSASLYDLLTAYAQQRQKQAINNVTIARRGVWSLKDARDILTRLVGTLRDWTALDSFLIEYLTSPEERRTAIASSFAATLELVREGKMEMRQDQAFAPLYLRGRAQGNQGSRGGIMSERANASVIPFKVDDETEEGAVEQGTVAEPGRAAASGGSRAHGRGDRLRQRRAGQRKTARRAPARRHQHCRGDGRSAADLRRRGVNLVRVGDAWAFRTAGDLAFLMSRDTVQQRKLSRAALEVLAIIAYHQPVTRAEIEDIRGVETSKGTLDTLMETEWVRMRGRRKTPGRPVTYGTTESFLDHFALEEIRDLPGMEELKGAGLLSARMPSNFSMPLPPADPDALTEDEDPLTDIDLEELGLLTPRVTED